MKLTISKELINISRRVINYFRYYSGIYALINLLLREKVLIILLYHRLKARDTEMSFPDLAIEAEYFNLHMKYLARKYKIVSMDDVKKILESKGKLDRNYAVVTFDDGYRDNYTYGLKIFKKYRIRPTFYITVNGVENQSLLWFDRLAHIIFSSPLDKVYIDILKKEFDLRAVKNRMKLVKTIACKLKKFKETDKLKEIDALSDKLKVKFLGKCCLMMNWNQVRELLSAGAGIGCHTMNHPILTQIPAGNLKDEIVLSKEQIEKRILRDVKHFAYTNGKKNDYNQSIKELVEKHYDTAVTAVFGVNGTGEDLYELKRIGVGTGVSLIDLKILIQNARICNFKSGKKPV